MHSTGTAQEIPMLHYTNDEGLPSNTIYSIYKDTKGFLWFASNSGIARYNGIKFEKFTIDDGLADNEVFAFAEDKYHRLWMTSYNGKLCYYKDGTFHNETNDPLLNVPHKEPFILMISCEEDSSVIFFFNDRRKILLLENNQWHTIKLSYTDNITHPTDLVEAHKHTRNTLALYYKTKKVIIDYNGNEITEEPYPDNLCFNKSPDRIYHYFFTDSALYTHDIKRVFTFKESFTNRRLYGALRNKNNFFICTDNGLYINNNLNLLPRNNVSSIAQDNDGNYWVSTLKNGVYYFDKNLQHQQTVAVPSRNEIRFSKYYRGQIYFTNTANDLFSYNKGQIHTIYSAHTDSSINQYSVSWGIDINEYGTYHSYYKNTEVQIKDIANPTPLNTKLEYIVSQGIKSLIALSNRVYVLLPSKLFSIDYNAKTQKRTIKTVDSFDVADWPFYMTCANDSEVWYSKLGHVYKIKNDTVILQKQFRDITFKWFNVYGSYLLGSTIDNKLFICNNPESNARFSTYSKERCVWVKSYKLDEQHVLIATNGEYRIITLYRSPDIPKYTISVIENPIVPLNAESICSDGETVYFFKKGIIYTFRINDLLVKSSSPKVYFTYLHAGNSNTYINNNKIQLNYEASRNIRIQFAVLSSGTKELQYEYSISLSEDKWQTIKGQEIDLANTGPGTYTVKLRAKTQESNYSDVASFQLIIENPFWKTWWFIVLISLVIGSVASISVYLWIRRKIRIRDREHTIKISLLKSEFKAMNALMNPHLIFNVLNNVQSLIDDGNKEKAHEYLQVFSKLMRQNLSNISKEQIPLQREIELLKSYLKIEQLRYENKFQYNIIVENVDTEEIFIPPLLIQPLAENAIIHGLLPANKADALLTVHIYLKQELLTITVTDNGVGLNESKKEPQNKLYESYGLDNVRKRIAQIAEIQGLSVDFDIRELVNDEGKTLGTCVTIFMQVS